MNQHQRRLEVLDDVVALRDFQPGHLACLEVGAHAGVVKLDASGGVGERRESREVVERRADDVGARVELALAVAEWKLAHRPVIDEAAVAHLAAHERAIEPRERVRLQVPGWQELSGEARVRSFDMRVDRQHR